MKKQFLKGVHTDKLGPEPRAGEADWKTPRLYGKAPGLLILKHHLEGQEANLTVKGLLKYSPRIEACIHVCAPVFMCGTLGFVAATQWCLLIVGFSDHWDLHSGLYRVVTNGKIVPAQLSTPGLCRDNRQTYPSLPLKEAYIINLEHQSEKQAHIYWRILQG